MLQISVFIIFLFISRFWLEICFVLPLPDLISAFYSSFKTILSCPLEHLFNHSKLLLTSSFFSSPESELSHFPLSPSYWRWLITPQFLNSRVGRGVTCLPYTFPPLDRYFSTLFYSFLFLWANWLYCQLPLLIPVTIYHFQLLFHWTLRQLVNSHLLPPISCPQSDWLHVPNSTTFQFLTFTTQAIILSLPNPFYSYTLDLSCEFFLPKISNSETLLS